MKKLSVILPLATGFALLPVLLHNNHKLRQLQREMAQHQEVIESESERISLLSLELNRLSHPERIEKLTREFLPHITLPKKEQIYILSKTASGQYAARKTLHSTPSILPTPPPAKVLP